MRCELYAVGGDLTDVGRSPRIMLLYWGRRGAMTQFALEAARAACQMDGVISFISVSRQNEDFAAYEELGNSLFSIDTFDTNIGALTQAWRIPLLRHRLAARLRMERIQAVIDLMPHVWAPFLVPAIRRTGARYVAVAHDASGASGRLDGAPQKIERSRVVRR